MKRILAIAAAILTAAAPAMAETVSAPTINVSANVADSFTISVDLKRYDGTTFTDIADNTQMSFGTLVPNNGTLVSPYAIAAFTTVNSQGDPYTINSNIVNPLTRVGGTETIPNGAFVLNSTCAAADQYYTGGCDGTAPASGVSAVGSRLIFTSSNLHRMTTVQSYYAITADGALGATSFVPLDQKDGNYTTTLVISATR